MQQQGQGVQMSTKSKLLAMTGNLQLPVDDSARHFPIPLPPDHGATAADVRHHQPPVKFPPVVPGVAAKTGPGQMLQFRGQMLAAEGEMGKLREHLKEYDGALPTRKLNVDSISPSRWANRHPDAYNSAEFSRLKEDIALAGGNVQAIAVRVVAEQAGRYEIVFGHRRHRACSELGIPVLATIVSAVISDLELFTAMDRENRERADLCAYEQGLMYRRALDEGLYPSNRRLAEALGVSHTWVANVLQVADLPTQVLECFSSPLEVQHRHSKAVVAAMEMDRKSVLRRAEKIRQQGRRLTPSDVVAELSGTSEERVVQKPNQLEVAGKQVGKWFKDRAGRLNIQIDAGVVSDERLQEVIRSFLESMKR